MSKGYEVEPNCQLSDRPFTFIMVTRRAKPWLSVMVILTLLLLPLIWLAHFFEHLKHDSVVPSPEWRVAGTAYDRTSNVLVDATVVVSASPGWSTLDRLMERSSGHIRIEKVTDNQGRFSFAFCAAIYRISFSKDGYLTTNLDFGPFVEGPVETNKLINVYLQRASARINK